MLFEMADDAVQLSAQIMLFGLFHKKSDVVRSGDLAVRVSGPPLPIHIPGGRLPN